MRAYRYNPIVSVQPLGAERVDWPPDYTKTMHYFVPTYVDERVCLKETVTADGCPDREHMVCRMPIREGTAYCLGAYGESWPVDADRATAPLMPGTRRFRKVDDLPELGVTP